MTRRDYEKFAVIVGRTLGEAWRIGGEHLRTDIYNVLYSPLVLMLRVDNPNFDNMKFAAAVGDAEKKWIEALS